MHLSIKEFKNKIKSGSLILDSREATEFTIGFIPEAVPIGLEGEFAELAGQLLSFGQPVIVVTPSGKEEETIAKLASIGFSKVEGYLQGGLGVWKSAGEAMDIIIDIEADELAMDLPFDENLMVLDVRTANEFAEGHVKGAINLPLSEMADVAQIASIEENQNIYIHCEDGYRSVIAASILKRQGYHNLRNILGGWQKIKELDRIPTEKDAGILN